MNYISYSNAKELASTLVRAYNDHSDGEQIVEDTYKGKDCRDYVKRIFTLTYDFTKKPYKSNLTIEEIHNTYRKKVLDMQDITNMVIDDSVLYIYAQEYTFSILITPDVSDDEKDYNVNTDRNVRQRLNNDDEYRPILLSYADADSTDTDITNEVFRNNSIRANPNTSTIVADNFVGSFKGDLDGNITGSSTSCNGNAVSSDTAKRLGFASVGSPLNPIYLVNGKPVACYEWKEQRKMVKANLVRGTNRIVHSAKIEYPTVTIYDGNNRLVYADIIYVDEDTIDIGVNSDFLDATIIVSI